MKSITLSQETRHILHTIKWSKANWIGHILRRKCLLKHYSRKDTVGDRNDGKTRTHWQLLQGKGHWKLKQKKLDCSVENSFCKRLWICRVMDYGMNAFSVLLRVKNVTSL